MLSLSLSKIVYIWVVIVLGYSLRGGTGFGAAPAMPLMGVVVPIKVLVPVWTVLSLCGAVTILGRQRGDIAWAVLWRLVPGCMLGIAIGLLYYVVLDTRTLAQGLGTLVVVYGGFSLRASTQAASSRRTSLWGDARLAGLFGGAVGTTFGALSSLFFAMHFDAIGMPKDYFRATMSTAVVAIAVARGFGYLAIGGYTPDVLLLLVITLPATFIGILIGERIQTGLSELTFRRLVSATLIVSGFALVAVQ